MIEDGVQDVILFDGEDAVKWNGVLSIQESDSSEVSSMSYMDGRAYRIRIWTSDFKSELKAYTYPEEFEKYENSNQHKFDMTYRTIILDETGTAVGSSIHLLYNLNAVISTKLYGSVLDDASVFSWTLYSVRPVQIGEARSATHFKLDSREVPPEVFSQVEDLIYQDGTLPQAEDILGLFDFSQNLLVVDNGDGSWVAHGPDDVIQMLDATTFRITWPSAVYLDDESYSLSTL